MILEAYPTADLWLWRSCHRALPAPNIEHSSGVRRTGDLILDQLNLHCVSGLTMAEFFLLFEMPRLQ